MKLLKNINKEKAKTVIIVLLLLVVGILVLRVRFEEQTVAKYRERYNEKKCPNTNSGFIKETPIEENNSEEVENLPTQKEKTKYEKILEKYTLGDFGMGSWLPTLLSEKLTDMNKLYIVLHNSDRIKESSSIKCEELFPNFKFEKESSGTKIIFNGESAFCGESNYYYDYEKLNAEYHSLFGKASNLSKIQGLLKYNGYSSANIPYPFAYSNTIDGYVELSCNCGGTGIPNKFYRIINTEEDAKKLIIDIKYAESDDATVIGDDKKLDKLFENENLKKFRFNFEKNHDRYYLISIDNI